MNTYKCTHMLLKHHFINNIQKCNLFQHLTLTDTC